MRVRMLLFLCTVICVFTVTSLPTLAIPSVRSAIYILMHEIWIPKQRPFCKPNPKTGFRDPGITNFSIPDPGIENSIPGLQSLVVTLVYMTLY